MTKSDPRHAGGFLAPETGDVDAINLKQARWQSNWTCRSCQVKLEAGLNAPLR